VYKYPTNINEIAISKLPIISNSFLPSLSTNNPAIIVNEKLIIENNKLGILGL